MSEGSRYIDRKTVDHSYRPANSLMSPGLMRAREPYRIRNAITGVALGVFAVGIWAYSISAVKQDVFDDVDEEARVMQQKAGSRAIITELSGAKEEKAVEAPVVSVTTTETTAIEAASIPSPSSSASHRGLLQYLDGYFPRLLDPERKTLVWGAPPVNNIGKTGKP